MNLDYSDLERTIDALGNVNRHYMAAVFAAFRNKQAGEGNQPLAAFYNALADIMRQATEHEDTVLRGLFDGPSGEAA